MVPTLTSLFRRAPAPLAGIDLSTSSVKVVELVPGQHTSMRLERYAIEPIERGSIVDGNIENVDAVAEALTKALRKCNSSARDAALALPPASVITKKILVPIGMREEDYEAQVEAEASQYLPFPIDEVNLDFQLLGSVADAGDEIEMLLAASRKEKVDERAAVVEMAGLRPVLMDVENHALQRALAHVIGFLPENGQGKTIGIFSIGHAATTFAVVLDEQMIFEREQPFGGHQLTQDMVRLYGYSPEEAERRKRSGDLPDNFERDLVQPFVSTAAMEISRALQFFFTSTPHTSVDRMYLAGGSSTLPGLVDAVKQQIGIPTELFSPFQGMELSDSIRDRQLRLDAPALQVATGLAMRRFDA